MDDGLAEASDGQGMMVGRDTFFYVVRKKYYFSSITA
jgi:hypothetical protein